MFALMLAHAHIYRVSRMHEWTGYNLFHWMIIACLFTRLFQAQFFIWHFMFYSCSICNHISLSPLSLSVVYWMCTCLIGLFSLIDSVNLVVYWVYFCCWTTVESSIQLYCFIDLLVTIGKFTTQLNSNQFGIQFESGFWFEQESNSNCPNSLFNLHYICCVREYKYFP